VDDNDHEFTEAEVDALKAEHGVPCQTPFLEFLDPEHFLRFQDTKGKVDRNVVYETLLTFPPNKLLRYLKGAKLDLHREGWAGGFGGVGWASAANYSAALTRAAVRFCTKPNRANWRACMEWHNRTINTCHNNGKILTKWVSCDVFDVLAHAPGLAFMSHLSGVIASGMFQLRLEEGTREKFLELMKSSK
jgi:hypothetical protein